MESFEDISRNTVHIMYQLEELVMDMDVCDNMELKSPNVLHVFSGGLLVLNMPKSKEYVSSESESDSDAPKVKPVKKKQKIEKKKSGASNDGEEVKYQLSKMRFASVSEFRGKKLVSIREYYEKDGKMLPGKKGISLSVDQWNNLKDVMADIDAALDE